MDPAVPPERQVILLTADSPFTEIAPYTCAGGLDSGRNGGTGWIGDGSREGGRMSAASGAKEQYPGVSGALPAHDPGLRWRRVFPGEERQISVLRRWLTSLLPECPAREDAAYVATELGSNAVRHTDSGRGGWLTVEVTWHRAILRVAVADCGSQTWPRMIEDSSDEHGRGLLLVRGLALHTGVCGDDRGRLVWADIPWPDPRAVPPAWTLRRRIPQPRTACPAGPRLGARPFRTCPRDTARARPRGTIAPCPRGPRGTVLPCPRGTVREGARLSGALLACPAGANANGRAL